MKNIKLKYNKAFKSNCQQILKKRKQTIDLYNKFVIKQ